MHINDIKRLYADTKRRFGPKTILLFRVDDSLEAYFNDAILMAGLLALPLENRVLDGGRLLPVASFPVALQEAFIDRLLDAGHGIHIYHSIGPQGPHTIDPL